MKEKIIKEKGITLIALVITIVVLLILSAIVLSAMKDSNIIGRAEEAKEEYYLASKNEEEKLKEYKNKLNIVSGTIDIDEILGKAYVRNWSDGGEHYTSIFILTKEEESYFMEMYAINNDTGEQLPLPEEYRKFNCSLTKDFTPISIKIDGNVNEITPNNAIAISASNGLNGYLQNSWLIADINDGEEITSSSDRRIIYLDPTFDTSKLD